MKTLPTLKTMRLPAKPANGIRNEHLLPGPLPAAARLGPEVYLGDSARLREHVLRGNETPSRPAWYHGGLND